MLIRLRHMYLPVFMSLRNCPLCIETEVFITAFTLVSSIQSHAIPVHIITFCFFNIEFNIILPSTSRFPKSFQVFC
jgi:hypothetical protein